MIILLWIKIKLINQYVHYVFKDTSHFVMTKFDTDRHKDSDKKTSNLPTYVTFKMASFVPSKRGNPKLAFEYHCYTKERNGSNGQRYWVCEQKDTRQNCPGRAITDAENSVKVTVIHNHGPSPARVKRLLALLPMTPAAQIRGEKAL
jgi:hypothetical protein